MKIWFRHRFRLLREGFRRALRVAPRRVEPAACGLPRAPPFSPPLDAPATAGGRVCVLAVATALFGAVDALEPLADAERKRAQLDLYENDLGLASCWFAFVDGAAFEALADAAGAAPAARACGRLAYGRYDVVRVPERLMPFAESGPNSRVPKMLGHLFLGHARYLLYMDAKIRLGALEDAWTLLYEELVRPAAAWASPAHPKRATPYEEARCVHVLGLAGDGVLAQMRAYRAAGLPEDAPLIEGEWHLRDLADNRSAALGCAWFEEFARWGHARDQISFNFAAWGLRDAPSNAGGAAAFVRVADYRGAKKYAHVERAPAYWKARAKSHTCDIDIDHPAERRAAVMAYIARGRDAAPRDAAPPALAAALAAAAAAAALWRRRRRGARAQRARSS